DFLERSFEHGGSCTELLSAPLDGYIPEKAWTGKDVSYNHLRVFGCKAFVHILKDERSKLEMKLQQCVFIDYGQDKFRYKF
uniref:Retroviral polymerase SH3-like domain-containing protein n=1 Tax=Brassica oleracea var. oleracea TaxID=109376 RepID=A0A0D3AGI1_BRAOL